MRHTKLSPLFSRPDYSDRRILSVYLNVNESSQINLNRGFEKRLKDITASIRRTITDPAESEIFANAAAHIQGFVSVYEVHARTLVMFFDSTDGFFWYEALNVPIETTARWEKELFLQPLIGILDEFEAYGIALLDHANLRLFTMSLGELKEAAHRNFSRRAVQHIRGVGTDHLGSAHHVQRKADERIRANVRLMIQDIQSMMRSNGIEHLILAGSPEITAELQKMLPKSLALRVIGVLDLSMEATRDKVFTAATEIAERYERDCEETTVREVVTATAKGQGAVAGLRDTLPLVNEGRVWQLIYSAGLRWPGSECSKCASLFATEASSCSSCGGKTCRVPDVIERAVEHAARHNARIEVVKEKAAEMLNLEGGIAAFLKARAARVRTV